MGEVKAETMEQFRNLFKPLKVGKLTVKNRIEASPMMPLFNAPDNCATWEHTEFYRAEAKGGAGIVNVGASDIDREYSVTHANGLFLDNDIVLPALYQLSEAIKRYGAIASLEMTHAGSLAYPELIGGRTPIGPSSLRNPFIGFLERGIEYPPSEEMTPEMIEKVVENYGMAALRIKRAGFHMAMLHAAHGILPAQFLSPFNNKRTDEYGGSLENRARFTIEVLDRIREKVGPDFALEIRFGADTLCPGGISEEEAVEFARMIEDKVDLLHVSAINSMAPETLHTAPRACVPAYLPHGINIPLAEKIKKAVDIPVTVVGAIMDLEMADRIIGEGKVDMVTMGRGLIADPELPNKAYRARIEEIRPCVRCCECIGNVATLKPIRCAVNPVKGREIEFAHIRPAEQKKKVLVAGGGPGGMQAALVAASRGHEVSLYEKSERLGGSLALAAIPSFKDDMKRYLDYMIDRVGQAPIKVKLNTEASSEAVKSENPDTLIIAAGARPSIPDIPGVKGPQAIWAGDVLTGKADVGDRVVVAGGGLVGCETALFLAQQGKKVSIVEMLDQIAVDMNLFSKLQIILFLGEHDIEIRTGLKVEEIANQKVMVANNKSESQAIDADTVVLALGMEPRMEVVSELRDSAPECYVIGDCVNARKLIDATREGFEAAVEI